MQQSEIEQLSSELQTMPYRSFVQALVKPGVAILREQTPRDASLEHMAIGVCGEAGELADAIKQGAIYGKGYDRKNIVEELGDLRFFMEEIAREFDFTEEEIVLYNKAKLAKRYAILAYTNAAAQQRADKA